MNNEFDTSTFELLVHLLEVSVVLGIGVIIYITKKYSGKINAKLEKEKLNELEILSDK